MSNFEAISIYKAGTTIDLSVDGLGVISEGIIAKKARDEQARLECRRQEKLKLQKKFLSH